MLSNHFNWSLSCSVCSEVLYEHSIGSTYLRWHSSFSLLYQQINMYSFLKCIIFVGCLVQVYCDIIANGKYALQTFLKFSQVFAVDYSMVTCDFDLIEIDASIAQYLPEECRGISSGSDIYNRMLEESLQFQKFDDQLNEYEATLDPTYVAGSEDAVPEKQWEFRFELYNGKVQCENQSDTQATYVDCLIAERQIMITKLSE